MSESVKAEQEAAADLYRQVCVLMRHRTGWNEWTNLENAARRFGAAMQARRNDEIVKQMSRQPKIPWQMEA